MVSKNFRGDSCLRSSYCSNRWIIETAAKSPQRADQNSEQELKKDSDMALLAVYSAQRSQAKLHPQGDATI